MESAGSSRWAGAPGAAGSPALIAPAGTLTHREMAGRVLDAARRLLSLGVRPGDPVALLASSSMEWGIIAHAVPRIGAVLLPINTRLTPEEIAWQADSADATLILHDEGRTLPDSPRLAIVLSEFSSVAPAAARVPEEVEIDPAAPWAIVFSSGTSGRPKGAVLTRANRDASAALSVSVLGLGPEDRWLACLPLFHVGGLNILYRCARVGAAVVLHERFDPVLANEAIDRGGVTLVSLVAVMLRRMIEARGGRPFPSSLRAIVVGGGPVPEDLVASCPQLLATYGMTETCSHVTLVRPGAGPSERRSAGRPLPGVDVRIVDRETGSGSPLPCGATGAIEVRGDIVMRGYLGEEPAVSPDGWFRTGDAGRIDAEGCLHVAGRRSDLIVSGGENVYPAEIEAALLAHPAVAEAAVIGVPDPEWGASPLAVVVVRGAAGDAVMELRSYLEGRLASYKIPRIVPASEIPHLPNGKPDRMRLASLYVP